MDLKAASEYNTLERVRINTDLSNAIEYNKILYLFAPMAWGKTTTLKSYLNNSREKFQWFDLKDKSIDINDFIISEDDLKTFIILDNFQEIDYKELINRLVDFIKSSPENYKFIILGRNKPPVYFSEFIVKRQIKILTSEDLSFTEAEIKEFYLENGFDLNNNEIKKIYDYTDGWPAIMAIVLMLLKLNYSVSDLVNETNEYIENFIEKNIWNKWDEQCKNFFMSISLFSKLPADLCIELNETYKEINILEQFWVNKLGDSYKMNSVLCRFLKNKVQIYMPDKIPEIHERIGEWFEKNNYEIEAIDSYFKANKTHKILEILEKNYDKQISISNINEIGKYLEKVINPAYEYSAVICSLMAMFEIVNCKFDNGQVWYKKLINIYEALESDNKYKIEILLKIIYVKSNMPDTSYEEIIKDYSDLLDKVKKRNCQ